MSDRVDLIVRTWRRSLFDYGGHDCLLSIGDYAKLFGIDKVDEWRGTYHTEQEAFALMRENGGADGLIDTLGWPRIAPDEAQRGDVVVIDTGEGLGVGALCTGSGVVARLERGVIEVSRRFVKVTHAWRVPHDG